VPLVGRNVLRDPCCGLVGAGQHDAQRVAKRHAGADARLSRDIGCDNEISEEADCIVDAPSRLDRLEY